MNQLRFAELIATKLSTVAVACPHCPTMLRDAANHINRDDVEILDLAEIVAKRIPPKSDADAKEGGKPRHR